MGDDVQSDSYVYRGYQVTIAHWTTAAQFVVRAEIRRNSEQLECVMTNTGPIEESKKLLRNMGASVLRWIDHRSRWR